MENQITNIQPAVDMPTATKEKITHKRDIFQCYKKIRYNEVDY